MLKSTINNLIILISFIYIITPDVGLSDKHDKLKLNEVFKNLKDKNFPTAIDQLRELSKKNNPRAQQLFSQILYTGEITTQDFEKSYYWAKISKLAGIKKNNNLIEKLDDLIINELKVKINDQIKKFLEKHALNGNKLAIIQIAKWNIELAEEPNYENAYKWYNIAVALGIKSAKINRDKMLNKVDYQRLFEVQKESNIIFKKINDLGG